MIPISELNFKKIGEIQKTRGYKGEVFINFLSEIILKQETEHIFIEIDGYMVPFFFSANPKSQKGGMIAKFENINNENDASELIGNFVFSTEDHISYPENEFFDSIEGFKIFDGKKYIGIASGFLNIPSNPILEVIADDGNEILIPYNEEFLIEVNERDQTIIFNLPVGLIEINL